MVVVNLRLWHGVPTKSTEATRLLQHLLKNKGRIATRDLLLDSVWGFEAALTTRTVDTHIKRLRAKLGAAADYIETIRGVGYRFRDNP